MDGKLLRDCAGSWTLRVRFLPGKEAENTAVRGAVLRCRRKPPGSAVMVVVRDRDHVRLVAS